MTSKEIALVCKALGDENRLRIVQMLSSGEMCAWLKRDEKVNGLITLLTVQRLQLLSKLSASLPVVR